MAKKPTVEQSPTVTTETETETEMPTTPETVEQIPTVSESIVQAAYQPDPAIPQSAIRTPGETWKWDPTEEKGYGPQIPKDESDPFHDSRMSLPVGDDQDQDQDAVYDFATNGHIHPLLVRANFYGPGLHGVYDGKTRLRRLPHVIKMAKKLKLPLPVLTLQEADTKHDELSMVGDSLNSHRRQSDPMTLASDIFVRMQKGHTEEEIAKVFGLTPKQVTEYITLLGLSDKAKSHVKDGTLTIAAAMELVTLDEKEQNQKLHDLLDKSGGKKVGKNAVKKAKGEDIKARMSVKDARAFQSTILAAKLKGDYGDILKAGMALALGVVDDPRTEDDFWDTLNGLLKGKLPKVEVPEIPKTK